MFAKIGWWERLRPTHVNDTYDTKTMNSCTNRGCLRGTWSLTDVHGFHGAIMLTALPTLPCGTISRKEGYPNPLSVATICIG